MTQQIIDIGAAANDGTGDPLRTAFDKSNDNFTELYGGVLPAFTPGSVAFAGPGGALTQDNANLFWDDAINRLVVGGALVVVGAMASTTTVGTGNYTVATLPSATAAQMGARAIATDCNTVTLQAVAVGGSIFIVPVYSDGFSWRVG